jgi:hypothetical protein
MLADTDPSCGRTQKLNCLVIFTLNIAPIVLPYFLLCTQYATMGSQFSHIKGYGVTKGDAVSSLRDCITFHFGAVSANRLRYKTTEDGNKRWYVRFNNHKYYIRFEGTVTMWQAYIKE